jgi:hypothetical protein
MPISAYFQSSQPVFCYPITSRRRLSMAQFASATTTVNPRTTASPFPMWLNNANTIAMLIPLNTIPAGNSNGAGARS